ncbi:unnamed protein product, partial [Brachionus calyciflorus]
MNASLTIDESNYNYIFFDINPNWQFALKFGYFSISTISIIGNLLIIYVVVSNKRMHNVTNYFITNLALVDIIISVFSTPLQFQAAILQKWIWMDILCKLGPFSTTLNINVSVLTLVVITLDRFYVIYYPLKPKLRAKHCFVIISFIWLISIVISSYNLFNYEIKYDPIDPNSNLSINEKHCGLVNENYSKYHLTLLTLVQFCLPFLIITSTSLAIFYQFFFTKTHCPISLGIQNSQLINRKKVIKMILVVLFVFILCWTPLQIYNILQIVYSEINKFYYVNIMWLIFNMLAMSNSCYNFIIYGFYS